MTGSAWAPSWRLRAGHRHSSRRQPRGGTCLRKLIFGSAGRFSEDLDFTLETDRPDDDVLAGVVEVFNSERHGVTFTFDEYYKTEDDTSFGGDVYYKHAWNDAGRFRLQVSLRERPTLPAMAGAMKAQPYFGHLESGLFDVRALQVVEMIAEKVRAAFQRVKVRDLYDLHRLATIPFNGELLRRLAVLKLWQARDPFDPEALFEKIREVIADAKSGWNEPLADRLRAEIRELAEG